MYKNGNPANFFLYADNSRRFEELLTTTLNGIDISFWYVSSRSVVLHAGLKDQLEHRKSNSNDIKRRNPKTVTPFPKCFINIKIQSQSRVLSHICYNKHTNLCKLIKNLWKPNAPIYKLLRSKAPKAQLIDFYKHPRKTKNFFSCHQPGCNASTCKNFAYLGSFAKFSNPVQSSIPCIYLHFQTVSCFVRKTRQ